MAFWDNLLKKTPTIDYEHAPLAAPQAPMENVFVNNDGSMGQMPVQNPRQSLGNRFQNALFGTMQEAPPQPTNIDGQNIQTGVDYQPRTGGILNDFATGYKQNRDNGFAPENLMPKDTNFAARSGEALGTLARQFNKLKQPDNLAMLALGLGTAADISNIRGGVYDPGKNSITNLNNMVLANKKVQNLNNYRNNMLDNKKYTTDKNDATKRANQILGMLNNGVITPEEAQILIADYGYDVNNFDLSNSTRNANVNEQLAPHRARAMDAGNYYTNVRANAAEQKAADEEYIRGVVKEIMSGQGNTQNIRVKAPNGRTATIPASEWKTFQAQGFTRI